ncbi:glucose-6-phosphatase 3 [Spea bombifrons]|uniref:glucose-6-phosphatase 3 n=1 Tax=Spea bombifrons TaxID=233779 RepID=UPI002349C62A|nr:glucose-6-phosphatase 3 [Spea bombifrons]XP_053309835.1 glucose-6-phosphatase 3 [Spea bombifrons]XP_053309836.1 glucose-6-phosphatase 3 [Spea bombifrons]
MDEVHSAGVTIAGVLQKHLPGSEEFWLWVTYLGDPSCVFLLYFPSAYAFQRRLGVTLLWLALISEWLNLIFKWFLFGERPFWWVYESGKYNEVNLKQFPSTCETGPGSPSGHCMITGAALWPVVVALTNRCSQRGIQRFAPILLYCLLMIGIAVSRVLILAHFPHQVVAGILTGVFLGHVLQRTVPRDRTLGFFTLASLFLLVGALLLNWIMSALGVDLSWSIHMATKWCSRPEWIRPESRPFSSITRSAGNALGLGLALHCPLYRKLSKGTEGWPERAIGFLFSFLFLKVLHGAPFPDSSAVIFYLVNFLRHSLCPLAVIILAPFITKRLGLGDSHKRD